MTEFEEIDGKLVIICDHEWGRWLTCYAKSPDEIGRFGFKKPKEVTTFERRYCSKCEESQLLVPLDRPDWLLEVIETNSLNTGSGKAI